MSKLAAILFCGALVLLVGCATPPNEPLPAEWSGTNEIVPSPVPPPLQAISPVLKTNPPPVTNNVMPRSAPVYTWTSLNRWATENKTGQPHLLARSPFTTYAINSGRGVMVLGIGSREATWNGVTLHLGFAPEFIDGDVFLHELDLQKNLEPLLCEAPLTFGTNRVIVIDPGHGGRNSGAICPFDGRMEKEFTLDLALRIKPLLEAEGWKVFLTRTSDVYVTNATRVVFVNSHHADLFVSLHFNATADRDKTAAGLETYCFTPTGMPSTVTRGYADPWSEKLSSNDFDAQNLQLAVKMQGALMRATGMQDRGVRHVRYIEVLRNQNCPAVLIENGYISNPAEAKKIESADFRQKLAEAIASALK